jgi:hypothetical protein
MLKTTSVPYFGGRKKQVFDYHYNGTTYIGILAS